MRGSSNMTEKKGGSPVRNDDAAGAQNIAARLRGHLAQHARLAHVGHVDEDVVCGVAVQRCTQALLVEVVADEANGATEDEEAVQGADLDVLVRLLGREGAGVAQQVDEADGDAAIDVEDELRGSSDIDHMK